MILRWMPRPTGSLSEPSSASWPVLVISIRALQGPSRHQSCLSQRLRAGSPEGLAHRPLTPCPGPAQPARPEWEQYGLCRAGQGSWANCKADVCASGEAMSTAELLELRVPGERPRLRAFHPACWHGPLCLGDVSKESCTHSLLRLLGRRPHP